MCPLCISMHIKEKEKFLVVFPYKPGQESIHGIIMKQTDLMALPAWLPKDTALEEQLNFHMFWYKTTKHLSFGVPLVLVNGKPLSIVSCSCILYRWITCLKVVFTQFTTTALWLKKKKWYVTDLGVYRRVSEICWELGLGLHHPHIIQLQWTNKLDNLSKSPTPSLPIQLVTANLKRLLAKT